MSAIEQIRQILQEYSLTESLLKLDEVPLLRNIQKKMDQGEKLTFILPAFPAKSPSENKTTGKLPDYGEVLALKSLQSFCNRISTVYSYGAELVICSDGRVFSDVVLVDDRAIDLYNEGIRSILKEYDLDALTVFTMDDLYPDLSPNALRSLLVDVYAMTLEEVKKRVSSDIGYRSLFNGLHRFLCEDEQSLNPGISRSALQKLTKQRTYELIRRSDAWSNLLNAHFTDALRLSIHPHAPEHEKFGIKLVPSSSKWATPWHNVVVKYPHGFELMHRKEALGLNAELKLERDKYAYFEISAI